MALCESGKAAGTMIYAMGRANHFWKPWDVVSEKQRATWKKEILRDYAAVHAVARSRGGGSAKAAASLTAGRAASISVRQIVGGDLETMLYTHLIVELGKPEFILDDWVERVREKKKEYINDKSNSGPVMLEEFQIYGRKEYRKVMSAIRKSKDAPKKPKRDWRRPEVAAQARKQFAQFAFKYVRDNPFPIQQKTGKPHPRAQERRLLTFLYYKREKIHSSGQDATDD